MDNRKTADVPGDVKPKPDMHDNRKADAEPMVQHAREEAKEKSNQAMDIE